jgi:hypothetical protein
MDAGKHSLFLSALIGFIGGRIPTVPWMCHNYGICVPRSNFRMSF